MYWPQPNECTHPAPVSQNIVVIMSDMLGSFIICAAGLMVASFVFALEYFTGKSESEKKKTSGSFTP